MHLLISIVQTQNIIKNNGDAIKDYSAALVGCKSGVDAYVMRARAYIDEKQYANAIVDLSSAISLDVTNVEIRNERGLAYYADHNYPSALTDFTGGGIWSKPIFAAAFIGRGDVYLATGHYDEARSDFYQAAQLNSNYKPDVRARFGQIDKLQSSLKEKLGVLQQSLEGANSKISQLQHELDEVTAALKQSCSRKAVSSTTSSRPRRAEASIAFRQAPTALAAEEPTHLSKQASRPRPLRSIAFRQPRDGVAAEERRPQQAASGQDRCRSIAFRAAPDGVAAEERRPQQVRLQAKRGGGR